MERAIVTDLPAQEHQHLCVNTFGHSVTAPCHKFGPAVRPYYLIHYILEGKGSFSVNNTTYHLSAGQGFLIEPDCLTVYESDSQQPWTYVWIGFSGKEAPSLLSAAGLSQDQPIFRSNEKEALYNYVLDMLAHNHSSIEDTYNNLGNLYHFLSIIAASNRDILPKSDGNHYVNLGISYIHNHLMEPFGVDEVAHYVGLNRSYFSSIFKQHTKMSPLEYIQTARLTKAKHMLEASSISVSGIAFSCGYQRPESLIKIFRKHYGISPAAYRRQLLSLTPHKETAPTYEC